MFAHTTHRILIGWLILALLLAQGMRVCIHAYGAPHIADHAHEVSAPHLESAFSMLDGHGEAVSDTHISLIGMLKHLSAQPLIAVVLLLTLILVLLQTGVLLLAQPRDQVFRPPHGHYFSPPLRAPPP